MLTFDGSQTSAYARNPSETPSVISAIEGLVGKESGAHGRDEVARTHAACRRAREVVPLPRVQRVADSIFADTHNTAVRNSLHESQLVSAILQNATLSQDWSGAGRRASSGHGGAFVGQLEQVSMVIASRHAFEAERDVFYIELGGFDHHSEVLANLQVQ
jgi:hypothetical protein